MRFMILVKADEDSEAGVMPSEELLTAMGAYNEELVKAGVMLAGEGLHPSSKGARVRFSGGKRTVIDGPFAEAKELVAGFWLWQVKSKEEAIEWVKRMPQPRRDRFRGRDPSGVRGRRLRRGAHPRAARAGGAPAQHQASSAPGPVADPPAVLRPSRTDRCAREPVTGLRDPRRAIDAVWRIESARLIAGLARMVRDVGLAEDSRRTRWSRRSSSGPRRASRTTREPGSWPPRSTARSTSSGAENGSSASTPSSVTSSRPAGAAAADLDAAIDDDIGDDLLSLVFTACHPVLSTEARVALTLRLLGGLTTEEIARAFLVPESTVAQRIVRAKRTLAEAQVPVRGPEPAASSRPGLGSVLEVVYLIFNEGYSATAGEDWMRPALCEEALRLGRILAGLTPKEPEVHGLVALMEIQASRLRARTGPGGEPILLLDQDRARWDQLLIRRGLAALARAEELGGALGPYALQAAIAACHARARTAEETDWTRIAALYEALAGSHPRRSWS